MIGMGAQQFVDQDVDQDQHHASYLIVPARSLLLALQAAIADTDPKPQS